MSGSREQDPDPASVPRSFGKTLFSGTIWMFAMRWMVRILGVVSVAFLARLLDQEDFGIIAMAATVIALSQTFTDVGVEAAIIREASPNADIYNTAWTIRLIQRFLISALVFFSAGPVAQFYGEPRLVEVIQILSFTILLQGFESIWVVRFLKEFNYRYDFQYNVLIKFITVICTISFAYLLQSYWALVYGQVLGTVLRVVMSYVVARKAVRPTLSKWRTIWSFSQWSLVRGIALYIIAHGDRMIIARLFPADVVGSYAIGREISELPMSEISRPFNRAVGPGFSALQTEPERLMDAVGRSLGAVATVLFPVSIGLTLTAEKLVPFALGPGWDDVVPIIQILGLGGAFGGVFGVMANILAMTGHIRSSAILTWTQALTLIIGGIPAAMAFGAVGMAGALLLANLVTFCATVLLFLRSIQAFRLRLMVSALFRPMSATALMAVSVMGVWSIPGLPDMASLGIEVALGASTYCVAICVLWMLAGRPDGIERFLFQFVRAKLVGASPTP